MSLSKHGAKAIKFNEKVETNTNSNDFQKKNVWFNWGDEDERTVRLVGDFCWVRTHWIGKSNFNKEKDVDLFNSKAFIGDKKLPMKINCSNWSVETEEIDENGGCAICQLAEKANDIMAKEGKHLDAERRQWLKNIIAKCTPKSAYFFKCIDRDNPFIAEGEKGYKIIQMSVELLMAITELDKKLEDTSISSEEDGIDIVIKREKPQQGQKGRTKYSALPVFKGVSVKQTPLDKEELSWADIDIKKFVGKPFETDALVGKFDEEIKLIWEGDDNNEESDDDEDNEEHDKNNESAPF